MMKSGEVEGGGMPENRKSINKEGFSVCFSGKFDEFKSLFS